MWAQNVLGETGPKALDHLVFKKVDTVELISDDRGKEFAMLQVQVVWLDRFKNA